MNSTATLAPIKGYTLLKKLGEGTSGQVWKATKAERDYAIKILKPGYETFVLAEFGTLQQLDHPNIITEYEIGTFDTQWCTIRTGGSTDELNGRVALVMELLKGQPLEKVRQEDYAPQELESIVIDIAEGLRAAHQQDIIHRDLKPANVFLSPDKRAKVLDFGVASGISHDPNEKLVAGSYSYMAPAQLLGKANLQNDIWSVGVTAYQLLTGRHPYRFQNTGGAQ